MNIREMLQQEHLLLLPSLMLQILVRRCTMVEEMSERHNITTGFYIFYQPFTGHYRLNSHWLYWLYLFLKGPICSTH